MMTEFRGEEDERQAIADVRERAAAGGTRLLVVFGADWCRDSAALERAFGHPLVAPLVAAGFEVVRLDVGLRTATWSWPPSSTASSRRRSGGERRSRQPPSYARGISYLCRASHASKV